MSGRMEDDVCRCSSRHSRQVEGKSDNHTAFTALSSSLSQPWARFRSFVASTSPTTTTAITAKSRTALWNPFYMLTVLLLFLVCFSHDVVAIDSRHGKGDGLVSRIRGREAPLARPNVPLQPVNIARRQEDDDDDLSTATTRTGSANSQRPTLVGSGTRDASSSASATATSTDEPSLDDLPIPAIPTSTGLPRPFDSSVGNNFTADSGCRNFLEDMLDDPSFRACEPLSLLLEVGGFV